MGFFQRMAQRSEQRMIDQLEADFRANAPHIPVRQVTLPCHIIDEQHTGVALSLPGGSVGIYHCQFHIWSVPLSDGELMRATIGDPGYSPSLLGLTMMAHPRHDLGGIDSSGTAGVVRSVLLNSGSLVVGDSSELHRYDHGLGVHEEESEDGARDTEYEQDDHQESETVGADIDWESIDFSDFYGVDDEPTPEAQAKSARTWLMDASLRRYENLDPAETVPLVTIVPDGVLLSFVGLWEDTWALVVLEWSDDPSDMAWALTLKHGKGDSMIGMSRWPLELPSLDAADVAIRIAATLDNVTDEHDGDQWRALSDAELTVAALDHDVDTGTILLKWYSDQVPRDADLKMRLLAVPRNIVSIIAELDISPMVNEAQRTRYIRARNDLVAALDVT